MTFHSCSSKITKNKDIRSLSEVYSATALITCVRIYSHYSAQLNTLCVQTVIANFSDNVKKVKQSRYRPGVAQRVPGS